MKTVRFIKWGNWLFFDSDFKLVFKEQELTGGSLIMKQIKKPERTGSGSFINSNNHTTWNQTMQPMPSRRTGNLNLKKPVAIIVSAVFGQVHTFLGRWVLYLSSHRATGVAWFLDITQFLTLGQYFFFFFGPCLPRQRVLLCLDSL
jgi:hypothetical protein